MTINNDAFILLKPEMALRITIINEKRFPTLIELIRRI